MRNFIGKNQLDILVHEVVATCQWDSTIGSIQHHLINSFSYYSSLAGGFLRRRIRQSLKRLRRSGLIRLNCESRFVYFRSIKHPKPMRYFLDRRLYALFSMHQPVVTWHVANLSERDITPYPNA